VEAAAAALARLGKDPTARWRPDQRQIMSGIQDQLDTLRQIVEAIAPLQLPQGQASPRAAQTNLNDLVRQTVRRSQPVTQLNNLTVTTELPPETILVPADATLTGLVLDGLMSNAIRYGSAGGQVIIRLEKTPEAAVRVSFRSTGVVIEPKDSARIFDENAPSIAGNAHHFGGLGIRLSLIKEIVGRQGGKIWLESQQGKGTSFLISLPMIR
jgi:signal transduction histidine kinase